MQISLVLCPPLYTPLALEGGAAAAVRPSERGSLQRCKVQLITALSPLEEPMDVEPTIWLRAVAGDLRISSACLKVARVVASHFARNGEPPLLSAASSASPGS
jgi:hypothetical protein